MVRWVKFVISGGISPVKALKERSTTLSWGEREEGRSPERLLLCRLMVWREGRMSTSDGKFPLRRLDLRLRAVSASSFPKVLAGIGPKSPVPGSRRAITRVGFLEQVIPTQEVQIGELAVQFSFLP